MTPPSTDGIRIGVCALTVLTVLATVSPALGSPLGGPPTTPAEIDDTQPSVLTGPALTAVSTGSDRSDPDHQDCQHVQRANRIAADSSYSPEAYQKLFSGDRERFWGERNRSYEAFVQAYERRCGRSPSNLSALLAVTDYSFGRPPTAVQSWNREVFDAVVDSDGSAAQAVSDFDRSVVPAGADTRRAGWLRDAHLTIHSVGPTTTMLHSAERTVTYASPTVSVRALLDYRVAVPANETTGPTQTRYALDDAQIQHLCVVNATAAVANSEQGATDAESPSLSPPPCQHPNATQLPLSQQIETTLSVESPGERILVGQVTYEGRRIVRECSDWRESDATCEGEWQRSVDQTNDSLIVTDRTRRLVPAPTPTTNVRVVRLPDNTYGVQVSVSSSEDAPLGGVRFGDSTLLWEYRYVTAAEDGWTELTVQTQNGTRTQSRHAHAVRTYAYPNVGGPTLVGNGSARVTAVNRSGSPRDSPRPRLPPNVNASVIPEPTVPATTVRITGLESINHTRLTVAGVTGQHHYGRPGRGHPNLSVSDTQPVRSPILTIDRQSTSDGQSRLLVTLEGPNGRAIQTASRPGTVVIGDRQIETNATGRATVTVDRSRVVTARYDPAPWYTLDQGTIPYTEARATSRPDPGGEIIARIAGMYGQFALGLLVPALIVCWIAYVALGADTWPPWVVFRR